MFYDLLIKDVMAVWQSKHPRIYQFQQNINGGSSLDDLHEEKT